jgi:hypothetical protein
VKYALLSALLLNASLIGFRCLQETPRAEAARPRGPVFTQAHADVLSHFSLVDKPFTICNEDDPQDACTTRLMVISGCSVQIQAQAGEPGSLFVGGDTLLNPFNEWPASGARFEGSVDAAAFFSPAE